MEPRARMAGVTVRPHSWRELPLAPHGLLPAGRGISCRPPSGPVRSFLVRMWYISWHVLARDQPPPASSKQPRLQEEKNACFPPDHQRQQLLGISLPPSPLKLRGKSGTQEGGHVKQSAANGRSNPSGLDIQAQVRSEEA